MNNISLPQRRIMVFAAALVIFTALSVAQESDSGSELRVVHVSPGVSDVSVFVDGEKAGESIGFGRSTSYIGLDSGSHEVELVSGGNTLLTRQLELEEGAHTLVLRDRGFRPSTTLLSDRRGGVAGDVSRVRVAHFSPDVMDLDVTLSDGGVMSANDLSYTSASSYRNLESGNYTITVRRSSTGERLLQQDVALRGGRTYNFYLSGLLNEEPLFGARPGRISAPAGNGDDGVDNDGNGDQNGDSGDGEENGDGKVIRDNFVIECRLVREED